ncbi:hypothetical protein AB0N07_47930 [Streptomyces sp. NPDC051172]|uniref:hypothetical protein n=1 Tax=Streptomyces sp. NPDC051172 TaxID=3155796 RepID=UPI00343E9BB1
MSDEVGEFRRSEVLVPVVEGSLVSAAGGVRWLFVCTDDAAPARFAAARGEAERVAVYGARLLDRVVPPVTAL